MAGLSHRLAVLRVMIEGPVTSFRYPHFVQGAQPSYELPPPATLLGHIASTLGEWPSLEGLAIGFHFTYQARFWDYEHIHLFGREAKLSPFQRELLFQPRLTLYINRPEWWAAFRHPRYVVTLGRSQDLMTYRAVEVVEVVRQPSAYLEQTLAPLDVVPQGYHLVNLPAYISPERQVRWQAYHQITRRQVIQAPELWVDPSSPVWRGLGRAVAWIGFDNA